MANLIDYSKSLKQIELFFEKYNEGKTMGDPTRLKSNTKSVAEALIRIYGSYLYKKGFLFVPGTVGAELYNEIPPLSTNNVRIAEKINATGRTVRTHIKKLVDAGFIIKKVTHGRANNFELWVNPEILGVKKKMNLNEIQSKITNEILKNETEEEANNSTSSSSPMRKNFPLNVSLDTENRNIDNDDNSSVDKVSPSDNNSVSPKVETIETTTETELETRERKQSQVTKQENEQKKVAAKKNKAAGTDESSFAQQKKKELDEYIKKLIDSLWQLAVMFIYKDMKLEEHQVIIAKKHLKKYFKGVDSKEAAKRWFEQYGKRLSMAETFYKNNPGYEKYLPSFYLDPTNKKGFVATKTWYLKYLKSKEKQAKTRMFNLAIQKVEAAPKDIGVYTSAQQSLSRFKDKELLDKFNKKVQSINGIE
ncbi:MAG: winged helix-turn-helix domain-containing protein [Balneolaceae bacterium]